MVRNPQWSQPVEDFIRQIKTWIMTPDEFSAMNLGIFFDAVAVAGRSALVQRAKAAMIEMMRGETAYLAHFARYIDQFAGASAGMLTSIMASVGVGTDLIDIKKAGTFPIVHGIRTLSIERGITVTATAKRIEALVAEGVLGAELGRELTSALSYFMEIRLRSQLRAVKTGQREMESIVRLSELSTSDRDLLRDALRVVKHFREVIRHRYHLGMLLMSDVGQVGRLIDRMLCRSELSLSVRGRARQRGGLARLRDHGLRSLDRRDHQHRGHQNRRTAHSGEHGVPGVVRPDAAMPAGVDQGPPAAREDVARSATDARGAARSPALHRLAGRWSAIGSISTSACSTNISLP